MAKIVVSYRHLGDPPKEAMALLEKKLDGVTVLDRMPGALLLDSTLEEVAAKLGNAAGDWAASSQHQTMSPPRRQGRWKGH